MISFKDVIEKLLKLDDRYYPIGSVIASTDSNFDPNDIYYSQTWERFAQGRTLVGVDENDPELALPELQVGEKTHVLSTAEIPAHNHGNAGSHTHTLKMRRDNSTGGGGDRIGNSSSTYTNWSCNAAGDHTHATVGSGAAHNNMQPSITVYYWRRIPNPELSEEE